MSSSYYRTDHLLAAAIDVGSRSPLILRTYDRADCAAEARASGRRQLLGIPSCHANEFSYLVGFTCEVPGVRGPRPTLSQVNGRWTVAERAAGDA